MFTITVTQKGQVVIPSKLRRKLHIKKGTKLLVREEKDGILLTPEDEGYIKSMRGSLKADRSMTEFLLNEHREELEMESKKWGK
ncbi:MAG: AbrB/MazE/SpoVT family DNA-binding domain-containing protein [Spirochaetia bacterium]|nr:AbrB/MazE/SpoVT family DNA-binding domain-containing protein [Spirochaetia bacterium]